MSKIPREEMSRESLIVAAVVFMAICALVTVTLSLLALYSAYVPV